MIHCHPQVAGDVQLALQVSNMSKLIKNQWGGCIEEPYQFPLEVDQLPISMCWGHPFSSRASREKRQLCHQIFGLSIHERISFDPKKIAPIRVSLIFTQNKCK